MNSFQCLNSVSRQKSSVLLDRHVSLADEKSHYAITTKKISQTSACCKIQIQIKNKPAKIFRKKNKNILLNISPKKALDNLKITARTRLEKLGPSPAPTRQQFFTSVSESTKNMLKQRFPNFFQIIYEIESII